MVNAVPPWLCSPSLPCEWVIVFSLSIKEFGEGEGCINDLVVREGGGDDPFFVGGTVHDDEIGFLDSGNLGIGRLPEGGVHISGNLVENIGEVAGQALGEIAERVICGS